MESSNSSTFHKKLADTVSIAKVKAITPESLETLRSTISKFFGNLIFRRVAHVKVEDKHLIETVVTKFVPGINPPGTVMSTIYKAGTPRENPTEFEYEHNVQEKYSRFRFFTYDTPLRDNDRIGKIQIFGSSNKYSQIDIAGPNYDFKFSYNSRKRNNLVPPRVDDLVCGVVEKDDHHPNPTYKFWFTCSEQFMHAWTAIKYSDHETFDKLITRPLVDIEEGRADRETEIRRALFRGNKLCTNSYRKWLRGIAECGTQYDPEKFKKEAENRFYVLRCEENAINWVHLYAALVLMLRYRELPTADNIPSVLDGGPTPKTWDLPEGWVDAMVEKYCLEEVEEDRKIYTRPPRIPKTESVSIPKKTKTAPTPVNTPSSPSNLNEIMSEKKRYAEIEFDDNLIFPKKINSLEFPPLSETSVSPSKFLPVGAWAEDDTES